MFSESILVRLGLDNSGFNRGLEGAKQGVNGLQKVFKTLAGFAVVGIFKSLVDKSRELADTLGTLKAATNISVETLQTLQIATTNAGGSAEQADKSIIKFVKAIGDARGGMAEAKKQFDLLGVSLVDASGKAKDNESILMDVADALSKIKGTATATSVSMKLFGETGTAMSLALAEGSKRIKEMREEYEKLNMILTGETIAEIDKLDKLQKRASDRGMKIFTERLASIAMYARAAGLALKQYIGEKGIAGLFGSPIKILEIKKLLDQNSDAILNQINLEQKIGEEKTKQAAMAEQELANQRQINDGKEKQAELEKKIAEIRQGVQFSRSEAFRMKTLEDVQALAGKAGVHVQGQRQGILAQRIGNTEQRAQQLFMAGRVNEANALMQSARYFRQFLTIGQESVRDPEAAANKQLAALEKQIAELQHINRQLAGAQSYDFADAVPVGPTVVNGSNVFTSKTF